MKRFILLSLLGLLFMASSTVSFAQRTVSGTVTSAADNTPLIGATVIVKGTTTGAVADIDGNFSVEASDGDVLVISYTGYQTSEVTVAAGDSNLSVALNESASTLTEVVVTGYTAQQKKDLTGAVGTVDPAKLTQVPSNNITQQLQGRVAGVTVSNDGRPGIPAKVRIRGFSSFTGANDPLYVVDGVPTQDISTLNPEDIESLSVLKDAGAASIYGSRASNGVVLITTKKGEPGQLKVSYSMYVGNTNPGDGATNLLNTQEYADLQWLVYDNDGTVETHPIYGESTNANPTLPSWAADTDWYDVLTDNALIMNHDVALSGGSENATFYAGMNYFKQDGILIHNFTERFSLRLNSEFKAMDGRLTIGENLTVSGRRGNSVAGNGQEGSPISMGIYRAQPIVPHLIPDGSPDIQGIAHTYVAGEYGGTGLASRLGNGENSFANQERNKDDRQSDVRVLGSMFADVKLMDGLNFRSTFGGTFISGYATNWTGVTYENAENTGTASYSEASGYATDWVWTNAVTFDKDFGSHSILAVGGIESVKYDIGRSVFGQRGGYFSEAFSFRTVSNGASIINTTSGFSTPTTLFSTFLRADYNYNDRYYLSATVRRDGSSRFGPDVRYGVFPSVSAGIRVSDFMEDVDFITDLKVRGGYGRMGNQLPVSPANQFNLFGGSAADANYDLTGAGTSSLQGFRPTRLGNLDTQWETQITTNVGFDASMFNDKLQMTFDWYKKEAQDLLVVVPNPAIYGAASPAATNVGNMQNTGIDLLLDYRDKITSDLSFEAILTFTTYKNEITKYADDIDFVSSSFGGSRIGNFNRNEVGNSIGMFYGYDVVGLFQSQADVDGAATQDGAEAGFFQFADTDGDGTITPDDRVFIGDPNPDFTYGLNLGLTYKNWDISAFFYGSQGNDIFNYNRWWTDFWPSFQGQKSTDLLNNSWTPSNTGATTPKASNKSNFSTNTQSTSYYVEDGSFLRLRTVRLGYTFSTGVLDNLGLSRLTAYVQGTNLFTMTDYSGLDPDLNNGPDLAFGVDLGNYPLTKQFIFGLSVGF